MRKAFLIASAIGLLCCASTAFAADVQPRTSVSRAAAPMIYAPVSNWSGFYVGADLGYGWQHGTATVYYGDTALGSGSGTEKGWRANLHAGYNWQFGKWVTGPEVGVGKGKGISNDVDAKWRLGYDFDRLLPYAAVGVDCAKLKTGVDIVDHDRRCGWTVGGGLNGKLTEQWIWQVQYTHANYGTKDNDITGTPLTLKTKFTDNTVSAGINYRW